MSAASASPASVPSSTEARAAAAAAMLCGPRDSAAVLARLGGVIGEEARVLVAAWTALDRGARARGIADAILSVRRSAPLGLALIHADWIEAALAGEGARVLAIVSGAAPAPPAVKAWLERRVLGRFVAMPRALSGPAAVTPVTLAAAPPAWIERALVRAGVFQLAHALLGQLAGAGDARGRAVIASLAARLGPHGGAFVDAVGVVVATGELAAAARWGSRRAAIARVSGASLGEDAQALLAIGARAFAPHLQGDAPRQLVQRLARGVGLRVEAELARGMLVRADPPRWDELVAA